jgi:hypothetical protein
MDSNQNFIDDLINKAKNGEERELDDTKDKSSNNRLSPNKIIDRLDDVTLKSEEEAGKVIDIIDETITSLDKVNQFAKELKELIKSGKADEDTTFKSLGNMVSATKEAQDELFNAMNLLQYQDVLRQKIEKIATALSTFYDYLGEFLGKGKVKIEKRAIGKHVEEATLDRDQKLEEIEKIIESTKDT